MKRPLILLVIGILLTVVPLPPAAVERYYSRGVYPWIQKILTTLSNTTAIAWLDVGVAVGLCLLLVAFVRRTRRAGWKRGLRAAGVLLLWIVAVVYLQFLVTWGFNYRRTPLENKLAFDQSRVTQENVVAFAAEAVRRANALHGPAHSTTLSQEGLWYAFVAAQHAVGDRDSIISGRPKRSLAGLYMRQAAFSGLTNPVFLEVILNPDLLPVEQPEVLAHEWGHLAGYADESEANFLAWITCLNGDPLAQYSGWLSAYSHAASALPRSVRAGLPRLADGPRQDFRAIAARINRSSPVVRTAAREVYDSYLKANRVEEGIASYDAVLRLMVGTDLGSSWK